MSVTIKGNFGSFKVLTEFKPKLSKIEAKLEQSWSKFVFGNKEISHWSICQSIQGVKKTSPLLERWYHHQNGQYDLPKVVGTWNSKTPLSYQFTKRTTHPPQEREIKKDYGKEQQTLPWDWENKIKRPYKKEMRWWAKFPSNTRNQNPTRKACWRTRSVSRVRFLFIATSSGSCNISSNRFSLFFYHKNKKK